jgi:hypothetical protein
VCVLGFENSSMDLANPDAYMPRSGSDYEYDIYYLAEREV